MRLACICCRWQHCCSQRAHNMQRRSLLRKPAVSTHSHILHAASEEASAEEPEDEPSEKAPSM